MGVEGLMLLDLLDTFVILAILIQGLGGIRGIHLLQKCPLRPCVALLTHMDSSGGTVGVARRPSCKGAVFWDITHLESGLVATRHLYPARRAQPGTCENCTAEGAAVSGWLVLVGALLWRRDCKQSGRCCAQSTDIVNTFTGWVWATADCFYEHNRPLL